MSPSLERTALVHKNCDYAHLPHSGGGANHGPAIINRGGYDICQTCYSAMMEAERRWEDAYAQANIAYDIDQRSSYLQRKCFL